MVGFVPKEMFFTKGVGKHREKLTSFELALRSAGIAACNLVRVSSIFPPKCRILSRTQGMKLLEPGQVTFVVMSEAATREPHRLLAATVGVAIPRDKELYGYLSEHHSFGESEDIAGDYAEELAAEMLATTLGLDFDPDKSWDEKKEAYRLSNQIVRTQNVTQTAIGDKRVCGRRSSPRPCSWGNPPAGPASCAPTLAVPITPHMRNTVVVRAALAAAFVVVSVEAAHAQIYETVGIRAQGMGGAFVAVADDATATWWNPAGLAGGAYVNTVIEYGTAQDPRLATDPNGVALPAWRSNTKAVSVAYPALGLSYYRLQVSQIQPIAAIGGDLLSRQDPGRVPVLETSLVLQQFGVTLGQSVGNHLVVGSTLKLVRGGSGSAAAVAAGATWDHAPALGTSGETHADLDLGAMARFGAVSVGAAVKNVREPSFGSGDARIDLRRQARVGVAVMSKKQRGTISTMSVAVDADLTTTAMATGDVRHVARGSRRVAVRPFAGAARRRQREHHWRGETGGRRGREPGAADGDVRGRPGDVRVGSEPQRLGLRPTE